MQLWIARSDQDRPSRQRNRSCPLSGPNGLPTGNSNRGCSSGTFKFTAERSTTAGCLRSSRCVYRPDQRPLTQLLTSSFRRTPGALGCVPAIPTLSYRCRRGCDCPALTPSMGPEEERGHARFVAVARASRSLLAVGSKFEGLGTVEQLASRAANQYFPGLSLTESYRGKQATSQYVDNRRIRAEHWRVWQESHNPGRQQTR